MHKLERVKVFTDKFPLLGPVIWVLCAQYFAAQINVAAVWPTGYSWRNNAISDLGNTVCGWHGTRYVCSPEHALMNASFIMLGVTMALGSLLIYQEFRQSKASLIGFGLMALAGFGTVLVGLFPENISPWLHSFGAFLAFAVGNFSMIVLALAFKRVRRSFRIYTFISGVLSLAAFVLYASSVHLGLGSGGMERVVSYPQTVWLILFGLYMSGSHLRRAVLPR